MEAFAAFRSSQLQPPRAYLLDPSAALPHTLELSGEGEGSEEGAGGRELKDLILVSIYIYNVYTCTFMIFGFWFCVLTLIHIIHIISTTNVFFTHTKNVQYTCVYLPSP